MIPAPHLNDYLKTFLTKASLKQDQIVKATRAPYLTLVSSDARELTAEVSKEIGLLDDDGIVRCPFPTFRYCVDYTNEKGNVIGSMIGYASRTKDDLLIVNFHRLEGKLSSIFQVMHVRRHEGDNLAIAGKVFDTKSLSDMTVELTEPDPVPSAKFEFVTPRETNGQITFDTASIKNLKVRALFEAMSQEHQQRFVEKAIQVDLHRHMDEDGFYKDPVKVVNRLTELDVKKVSKSLADDLAKDIDRDEKNIKSAQNDIRRLQHHVAVLKDMNKLCEAADVVGSKTKQTDFGSSIDWDPESKENSLTSMFFGVYRALLLLCYEYIAPQNFIAKVIPSANGKSVEWIQSREHFTTIHRHHEANRKDVKEGQVVKTDRTKAVLRTAHSRRAHTRLLTAARYTYMRGKRVPVKATWCGPKEWQDTAGQTYKILIPVT